ncbi:UNVERIFIED_CONTAM: hypothetical protein HDU68_009336 [Siphonaria sp. JEL0065]|nr:hypothetical protein HDU68_009336 [Siphonaria sp. JEL0065]
MSAPLISKATTWIQAVCLLVSFFLTYPVTLYKSFMAWPQLKISDYSPPPKYVLMVLYAPFRWLFPLRTKGLDNLIDVLKNNPNEKFMFVGNHLYWGVDLFFVIPYIYLETGIYLRGIADVFHFTIPVHKHFLEYFGGVKGTVENCTRLMESGQPLILLPGGAEEVLKDARIPRYTLIWKDRAGFARLSAHHGYKIVPFGIVGFEDMLTPAPVSIPTKPLFALIGDARARDKAVNLNAHKTSILAPVPDMRIQLFYPWISLQMTYLVLGDVVDASKYNVKDIESVYELRNQTLLVIGLGNTSHPNTRHNIGMMALDNLLNQSTLVNKSHVPQWTLTKSIPGHTASISLRKSDFPVVKRKGIAPPKKGSTLVAPTIDATLLDQVDWESHVVFLKVKGFMNLSGVGVAKAAREYKVKPSQILVLHDELEKKLGSVTFKASGSAGGHNGLRSIQSTLHTDAFGRLRIGIDRPANKDAVARYVLEKFLLDEEEVLEEQVYAAVEKGIGAWVKKQMEEAVLSDVVARTVLETQKTGRTFQEGAGTENKA